jgi:hypothetical protein
MATTSPALFNAFEFIKHDSYTLQEWLDKIDNTLKGRYDIPYEFTAEKQILFVIKGSNSSTIAILYMSKITSVDYPNHEAYFIGNPETERYRDATAVSRAEWMGYFKNATADPGFTKIFMRLKCQNLIATPHTVYCDESNSLFWRRHIYTLRPDRIIG